MVILDNIFQTQNNMDNIHLNIKVNVNIVLNPKIVS